MVLYCTITVESFEVAEHEEIDAKRVPNIKNVLSTIEPIVNQGVRYHIHRISPLCFKNKMQIIYLLISDVVTVSCSMLLFITIHTVFHLPPPKTLQNKGNNDISCICDASQPGASLKTNLGKEYR